MQNRERQPLLQRNQNNNERQNNDVQIDVLDGALPMLFNEPTDNSAPAANSPFNIPTVDDNFLIAVNMNNFQDIRGRIGTLFFDREPATRLQILQRQHYTNIGLCFLTFTLCLLGLSGLVFTVDDSSEKVLRPSLEISTVAFLALLFVAIRRYAVSRDTVETERNRVAAQAHQANNPVAAPVNPPPQHN